MIKKWKAFDCVFPNAQIPYIGDYVRIICSIINAYSPNLVFDQAYDDYRAEAMKLRSQNSNELQLFVEENRLSHKTAYWQKIYDESVPEFPRLSLKDLKDLTLGIYQVRKLFLYTFKKSFIPLFIKAYFGQ